MLDAFSEIDYKAELNELNLLLQGLSIAEQLALIASKYGDKATFSTSFGIEDQLISHYIFSQNLPIPVFTLDTGRMFPETYSTWSSTLQRYKQPIEPYYPNAEHLQVFIAENGPNSFYESIENRKNCCYIRKVAPLKKALANKKIWITGIRAEHSLNRNNMPSLEWDEGNNLIKFHPLLHWSTQQVQSTISSFNIPYNPLHDKGFVSIGCAPCTRAIQLGQDFRAGRWWWEDADKKECGLHINQ